MAKVNLKMTTNPDTATIAAAPEQTFSPDAAQEPGTTADETPAPSPEPETTGHDEVTESYDFTTIATWPENEVLAYYKSNIGSRAVSELEPHELEILARYGEIAKNRRDAAEEIGFDAEIEAVRRKVQQEVDRQALASYINGALKTAIVNLKNKRENRPTVEIEFRFGERQVVFTAEELASAFGTVSNKLSEFQRTINNALEIVKQTAIERRRKIEKVKGRDFSRYTADIRATTYVEQWKAEDAKE